MEKLLVKLKNCYGIKSLQHEFDFTNTKVFTIYAPNGSMKTSFADTFKDLGTPNESRDKIYLSRDYKRLITDENGAELENVFVIERLAEDFVSDRSKLLLAKAELQKNYQEAHQEIEDKEADLISVLREYSGYTKTELIKREVESIYKKGTFFECLQWVYSNVKSTDEYQYDDLDYRTLLNSYNLELLNTSDIRNGLVEYSTKYQELVEKTKYLKSAFDHYGAFEVQKALDKHGFFKANHSVVLKSEEGNEEINSGKDLQDVFSEEMKRIIEDKELEERFKKIDNAFKREEHRYLRTYIKDNPHIIPKLLNTDKLRMEIWNEYFAHPDCLKSLINFFKTHDEKKAYIQTLIIEARRQESEWYEVIDKFNKLFIVPFKLVVSNVEDVVLKSSNPSFEFEYQDTDGLKKKVDKEILQKRLSCGEQRALYLLNIMFEIETRKKQGIESLIVIDDIADSFDYKNKYAIIEYLHDMKQSNLFKMIILTHNFDFFRNIISRLGIERDFNLVPVKTSTEITLVQASCQKTPFDYWMSRLHVDNKCLIASIPFVRNLAEYTGNTDVYDFLTQLLHVKQDTYKRTVKELIDHFKRVRKLQCESFTNDTQKVMDILTITTNVIIKTPDYNNLEDKVVLAIAIRLKAEQYMISKISDLSSLATSKKPQTWQLFDLFRNENGHDTASVDLLNRVVIMTPENIHLNSFMYEPILDMDIDSLIKLYSDLPA